MTMTHVSTGPNNQFSKVASMGHHKHIRLEANQEVKGCQACHMLPESIQLFFGCQLFLCYLSENLGVIYEVKTSNFL
jgi:hypothetical protein